MHVIFNHGKESGPWGTKISALANTAESLGCSVESLDYRGEMDADKRVKQLYAHIEPRNDDNFILVGSSMGGYVATAAADALPIKGLFLLAPAFYLGGYTALDNLNLMAPISIVHGWRDDVVPVANSWRFAQSFKADLHVLDDDHRLVDTLPHSIDIFRRFLSEVMS